MKISIKQATLEPPKINDKFLLTSHEKVNEKVVKSNNKKSIKEDEYKKNWTEKCPEQQELNKLFETNQIDDSALPNKIRQTSPSFMAFPAKTFAAHFRKTKARYGAYANNDDDNDVIVVPELGAQLPTDDANKKRKVEATVDVSDNDNGVKYNGSPSMTWTYFDHDQKVDIVNVAVPAISGIQNVNFGLSEDGWQLIVKYIWPAALYTPALLFSKKVATHPMSHPQVHSFASEVLKRGFTQKNSPGGNVVVPLPLKVQREVGTWNYEGMKIDGCDVLLLQFKAFQTKVVIDDADTSVTFK